MVEFIFDLDDTLIATDKEANERSHYAEMQSIKELPTMALFKKISILSKWVITSRPPCCRQEIADLLNIPPNRVLCRNFQTDLAEFAAMKAAGTWNLEEFLRQMVIWKNEELARIVAEKPKHVYIFIDDMAARYKDVVLPKNVLLMLPCIENECGLTAPTIA